MRTRRDDVAPYVTKDGSLIRELMHPDAHPVRNQSLAEACVPVGGRTEPHAHMMSEELYHVLSGRGRMTLGELSLGVEVGDTVLIPPDTPHCVENTGDGELRILCCCSPAYSHQDTRLLKKTTREDQA